MFVAWSSGLPTPDVIQLVTLHRPRSLPLETNVVITRTPSSDPLMSTFRRRIVLGNEGTVSRSPPRIRIRVTLGDALALKARATEVPFVVLSAEDTHTRLLSLPTPRLTIRAIELLIARVLVFGQAVSMATAGGVTRGHRVIGKPTTVRLFVSTTTTVSI